MCVCVCACVCVHGGSKFVFACACVCGWVFVCWCVSLHLTPSIACASIHVPFRRPWEGTETRNKQKWVSITDSLEGNKEQETHSNRAYSVWTENFRFPRTVFGRFSSTIEAFEAIFSFRFPRTVFGRFSSTIEAFSRRFSGSSANPQTLNVRFSYSSVDFAGPFLHDYYRNVKTKIKTLNPNGIALSSA